jgi:trimethylamine---corrinoid protein Co-methyltransferase
MEKDQPTTTNHTGLSISKLTEDECERLHEASLEILGRTGVRLYEQEALDLLKDAGVPVRDGNRVRLPRSLVEDALASAPKGVRLHDREGELAMSLEGARSYFGPGCDCLYVIDRHSGERRKARLQDVANGMTVCDALENVDFVMSMFLPSDVNSSIADRYQMQAMLRNTTKPMVFVTHSYAGWVDTIEMAEVAVGGPEALRQRPFVAWYINSTTSLRHNKDSLQKLLYAAKKGLPTLYIGGTSAGLTAPVTVAANLALRNAGSLVGVVISQLVREGTPIIVAGSMGGGLDMRSMVLPYGEPQPIGGMEALAHYYCLPMLSTAGASNAKLVDQQAAVEPSLTLMVDALCGGHLVHNMGYLESAMAGSLAQLVICNEIVDWIKAFTEPVAITDETLALDLIDEIGPDGSFLETEHTLRHYRERWYPNVIERWDYDQWHRSGQSTLAERATEEVDELLESHEPTPLSQAKARAIHAVVERAEREHGATPSESTQSDQT